MITDVQRVVLECEVTQRNKEEQVAYPGLLQPLSISGLPWEHINIDFIEGLPRSKGKDTTFDIVDKFSKYAYFLSLTPPFNAMQVPKVLMNNVDNYTGCLLL